MPLLKHNFIVNRIGISHETIQPTQETTGAPLVQRGFFLNPVLFLRNRIVSGGRIG
jgi:hypothetical protein